MAALSPKRMSRKLVAGITYPHDAVTSNFLSATTLMAWRAFLTVVFLAVLILAMVRWFSKGDSIYDLQCMSRAFFMFTHLNHFGLMCYLGMSTYLGYRFTRAVAAQRDMDVSNVTATIHSLLYTFNCTNHPIVVVVYWLFLSDNFTKSTSTPGRFVSVFMHGVTLVIVLLEISYGRMRMNWIGIVPVLVLLVLYTCWAIIYHAIGDAWVYSFLDYTKPAAAYMYPGVLVAAIVFFCIMVLVHRLRDAVVGRSDGYEANKEVELSATRLNASDNV
ncbi:hypothetical protein AMAG_04817 [Allomyces macrogynus ATCC 38327]|uniref:FAR-17a/AIG1-like protein n=1 Tax=Allomyces macrogynus (strain ATCC 38327) TaxID=578462 RepID=A0A0L0S6D9_ALLM3|nr:hypothetical protein AMAG_04817 [Allomyces macrogynus ATCC 38327]|eukprot:KNE57985.1 hypothetical protein AMAG_04817 [Allomyces macrogynus ATCC 38327]